MTLFFTNKNYRLLFSASAVSNLGDGVSALALPWLASLITRDPMLIATVAFATRLPWFLCSIPAGVITDRYDRKHLMVGADILRMILTAGLVVCALTIPQPAPAGAAFTAILMVSGLAFLLGLAEVVRDNAAQTVLPSVVAKSDLERANGQLWSIEQIMGAFIGPPLAGFLIAWAVPAPFVLDTLSFALAAGMVFFIAIPSRPAVIRRSVWREAVEGMVWIRSHRVILQLALMLGVMNALGMLVVTILVLYSQEVLGLSVTQHGLLLIAGAAGGVVGGVICPKIAALIGRRSALHCALLGLAVSNALLALVPSVLIVALALFLEMFAALLWNVVTVSYRQRFIPDALLGRVNSIYRFFGWGLLPFGALASGAIVVMAEPDLGRALALRMPLVIAAVGSFAILLYGLVWLQIDEELRFSGMGLRGRRLRRKVAAKVTSVCNFY